QSLGSRVELGGTLTAAQARSKSTPTSGQQNGNAGAVSGALQYVPILPVRQPDGSYTYILTALNAYNTLLDAPATPNPVSLTNDRHFTSQSLPLLGGYSRQSTNLDGSSMTNTNFVSDITGYFDIGSGTQTGGPSISSRNTTQTLESWISRLNYSLFDRYLF